MKLLLKIALYALGACVVAIALSAGYIYLKSNSVLGRKYAIVVKTPSIPSGSEAVARGLHIATTRGCADCHGPDFGGKTVFDNPAMGRVDAPNLTRGQGGVPADYRDEDWVRAIRHGVARDGRGLFLMPSTEYAIFSDADLGALIAYLRSLPAVDRPRGPIDLGPIARMLTAAGQIKLAAQEIDHASLKPATIAPAVSVEYGRYMANGCIGCHGPNFSGGKITVGPPDWPIAANLTPHPEGRVAKWSEADFLQTMRTAKRPDGSELHPAMPRAFGGLDDTELRAIWAYLRSLPPISTGSR